MLRYRARLALTAEQRYRERLIARMHSTLPIGVTCEMLCKSRYTIYAKNRNKTERFCLHFNGNVPGVKLIYILMLEKLCSRTFDDSRRFAKSRFRIHERIELAAWPLKAYIRILSVRIQLLYHLALHLTLYPHNRYRISITSSWKRRYFNNAPYNYIVSEWCVNSRVPLHATLPHTRARAHARTMHANVWSTRVIAARFSKCESVWCIPEHSHNSVANRSARARWRKTASKRVPSRQMYTRVHAPRVIRQFTCRGS